MIDLILAQLFILPNQISPSPFLSCLLIMRWWSNSSIALLWWWDSIGGLRVSVAASCMLNTFGINTRCRLRIVDAGSRQVTALEVHVFNVERVDVAGEVSKDREKDVNEEVGTAASD